MAKLSARDAADGWPLLRRLWREELVQHRLALLGVLGLVAIIAAMTSLYPVLIKLAFDSFATGAGGTADPLLNRLRSWLVVLTGPGIGPIHVIAVMVVVVTSVKGFALLGKIVLTNSVVSRVEADMQGRLYEHLVDADLAQAQRESPAALTQRFSTDFIYVREALTRLVNIAVRDGLTGIGLFGAMLWIDWQLTLIALVVVPIVAVPIVAIGKKLRRVATSQQEQSGIMAALITESLQGARVAKTDQLEPYLKRRARAAFEMVRKLRMKAINARGRVEPLLEVGGGIAVAVVLFAIGIRVNSGVGTIGDFTGYVTALLLASQPLRSIGNLNAIIQEALAALKRYYSTVNEPALITDAPDARPLTVQGAAISFRDVSFSYREDHAALRQVGLEVAAGSVTALVGRSGSGKSTLLALVPRLYDVTAGTIAIDGQDIRSVTLASLRDQIAVVSQDIVLFDDSIKANIAFGRPGAPDAEIEAAAESAAAHGFILALPDGYATRVGDRGSRLSGGERQRVALARAILKNAPILLLDEATSALDAESEKLVQDALARLMKGRTTLVIAHRLSTVREADQIAVMEGGQIVERGHHDALIAADGVYAKLHRLQMLDG
ncbi:MAG: ATP-binding cassette domain-containing protein [Hyphomicrobiales bacterium]|nr:ATP-binding cassette domain-containing protein [Hyphomicrobiales bacterium]